MSWAPRDRADGHLGRALPPPVTSGMFMQATFALSGENAGKAWPLPPEVSGEICSVTGSTTPRTPDCAWIGIEVLEAHAPIAGGIERAERQQAAVRRVRRRRYLSL